MKLQRTLANMLIAKRMDAIKQNPVGINDVAKEFESFNQQSLGTYAHKDKKPRTRKEIYSMWELMQTDPQVAESLSLHVTAALGGHETTGDMVFVTPHERIRGKGRRAADLRERVESCGRVIAPMLNQHVVGLARQAVGYGDSYARIYSDKRSGVTGLMNNVFTRPPMIMPFEQGGRTIGFHALENDGIDRCIAKLSPSQLLRVKMPRIEYVPQVDFSIWQDKQMLKYDQQHETPIMPSEVGGSFLYPVEGAWQDVTIARMGLNNQQIADSVKQAFLTVNMEGMPAAQRKGYREALTTMLKNYKNQVDKAFKGGEPLYGTQFHIAPQWGEKQILQSVGDMAQRITPMNDAPLMLSIRRLQGGLGIDMSLVGWADMLAGGLGDGATFHTSAQMMRRVQLIRPALIDSFNHLMSLHWGILYDEHFEPKDYPWQFDFYSDQGAAATEALTNKQMRANTLAIIAQSLLALKETGLSTDTNLILIEDILGADNGLAARIAKDLKPDPADDMGHGMDMEQPQGSQGVTDDSQNDDSQNDDSQNDDSQDSGDDELPSELDSGDDYA